MNWCDYGFLIAFLCARMVVMYGFKYWSKINMQIIETSYNLAQDDTASIIHCSNFEIKPHWNQFAATQTKIELFRFEKWEKNNNKTSDVSTRTYSELTTVAINKWMKIYFKPMMDYNWYAMPMGLECITLFIAFVRPSVRPIERFGVD